MPLSGLVTTNACMLTKRKKQNVIKKYQTHEGDTGSSQVQIAILTTEIEELVSHLKKHHKDHSSRRGLLRKVGERRRLLRYLNKEDKAGYEKLVIDLKLKQAKKLVKPTEVDIDEDQDDTDIDE
jgi:small subunit ribosomal protein S15